jgi:predicted dehydrogenase
MSVTKVGMVSFAHHHAEAYVAALRSLREAELVGFVDDEPNRAQQMSARLGLKAFGSIAQLAEAGVEAVVLCSENSRHRRDAEESIAAGLHVLSEKPLATGVADAQAMADAARAAQVVLSTAFPMRFNEAMVRARRRVSAGDVGTVLAMEGVNQGKVPTEFRAWFTDPRLAGGGAITDHLVHLVDLYRFLLEDEVTEVYAKANRVFAPAARVETGGLASLAFAGGAVGTIDFSWSRSACYPAWGGLSIRLVGTAGTAFVDAFGQRFDRYSDIDGSVQALDFGTDANAAMIRAFLAAVAAGDLDAGTGVDGLRAAEVTAAAYESVATGLPAPVRRTTAPGRTGPI